LANLIHPKGDQMNKKSKTYKLSTLLIATLLIMSVAQIFSVSATVNSNSTLELNQKTLLTDAQIKATWPNIPTAKQLYDKDICFVMDLRYCGKQEASITKNLPDPESPTVMDIASTIVNCTTTTVNLMKGGLIVNNPQIWLQYNSSVWVKVPQKYLQISTPSVTQQTDEDPLTWAVGMYANPQQVTGSYDVWGVCSFGQWNSATFGSSDKYIATNALTVPSSNIGYQMGMILDPNGRSLVWNWWSLSSSDHDIGSFGYVTNADSGKLYNMYIKYVTGSGWQYWWNQTYLGVMTGDSSTIVKTGSQANVVVESNDFTSSDFSGFSTSIGGTHSGGQPLCAAVYLYNGNWKPSATGDSAPYGYTYLGGTFLNGFAIGGQAPPSTWGSSLNIGQTSSLRERFTVGAGLTQRTHGYQLWTSGTV